MIDLTCETLVPLAQCSDLSVPPVRRTGRPIHVATWHRWATKGLQGVRLETLRVGGTRCTTLAAIQRFFAQLSAVKAGPQLTADGPANSRPRPLAYDEVSTVE